MGKTQGDVESHGPHLWDGLNMVMGGSRADGVWDNRVRILTRPQESSVSSWERMRKPHATGGPGRWWGCTRSKREESAVSLWWDVCSVPTLSP